MTNIASKDLTKVAPRSAYETINGFAILARAIDKGRATIAGTNGDYNFDCPVDNMILNFVGIKGEELRAKLEAGATDEEIGTWVKEASKKSDEEIKAWSESFKSDFSYAHHPDAGKQAWFRGECERLGLNADTTTLFDYLDVDDKATFAN
ncbi:MAG: hypothetical protein RL094_344 [Candidatus Parcubacteria bacterium]|jgi:hypothetical protein